MPYVTEALVDLRDRARERAGELEEQTAEFDALGTDGLQSLAPHLEKKKLLPLKLMAREEWEKEER